MPEAKSTLPPEKVFSIQIGTELFRLSGASIASDAPSYFSRFFEDQICQSAGDATNLRTLYIDRDPGTFREVALHLQGYHIRPSDSSQFVKLFADAQFYSLPRLTSQLFSSDIFIQIGSHHFQIPRDIFSSPGNSPNFFTLGFADFFASPSEVFPGLDRTGLLRPPAIQPPKVANRSGEVFADLLHLLRGYPLEIRGSEHREALLRDCRYYYLRGLEQQLIPHEISPKPSYGRSEIVLRIEDVRESDVQAVYIGHDPSLGADRLRTVPSYARPFVDGEPHDLIVELGPDTTTLDPATSPPGLLITDGTRCKLEMLLQQLVKQACALMGKPDTAYREIVNKLSPLVGVATVIIDAGTDLVVDGEAITDPAAYMDRVQDKHALEPPAKRRRLAAENKTRVEWIFWYVRMGQWQAAIDIMGSEVHVRLVAVKLDICTGSREWNRQRAFLST